MNKQCEKIKIMFNVMKWLFVANVGLTIESIVTTLVARDVTIFNYVLKCVEHIVCVLLLAFIFSRTEVKPTNEEE